MNSIDWGNIIVFLVITAVHAGIVWQRMQGISDRIKELEKGHVDIKDGHQRLEVNIVNVPSKEDIKELGSKISGVEKSIVKLEVILDIIARNQSIPGIMRRPSQGHNDD